MDNFLMNGYLWRVYFVRPDSPELVDRTGSLRVATTDPKHHAIYISNQLDGDFLVTVLLHELGHCVMVSYDMLNDIHLMVRPEYWIQAEEWVCNFIADYGRMIFSAAYRVLGDYAWNLVPYELEKLVV